MKVAWQKTPINYLAASLAGRLYTSISERAPCLLVPALGKSSEPFAGAPLSCDLHPRENAGRALRAIISINGPYSFGVVPVPLILGCIFGRAVELVFCQADLVTL